VYAVALLRCAHGSGAALDCCCICIIRGGSLSKDSANQRLRLDTVWLYCLEIPICCKYILSSHSMLLLVIE
jgi:hypothetical protein